MEKDMVYTFVVERADPDKDHYLLRLYDFAIDRQPVFCLLEKNHAVKPLSPGDIILAAATGKKAGRYPVVSQKIPSHIIKVLRMYFHEELDSIGAFLDRVAATRRGRFCKVGVWGKACNMDFYQLNEIIRKKVDRVLDHIPYPILIPTGKEYPDIPDPLQGEKWYDVHPPETFILRALYPADITRIERFEYDPEFRRAYIFLKVSDFPRFLWKDYLNAKLASKLTKVSYHFVAVETGQEIVVDPFNVEKFLIEKKKEEQREK